MHNITQKPTNSQDPEFEAMREAILPSILESVRQNNKGLDSKIQESLASIGASLAARNAQQAKTQQAPLHSSPPQLPQIMPPAPPPTKPSTRQEAKPSPKGNEVMQFELPLSERARPVSNSMARSALFAAIGSDDRQLLNKVVLVSQNGIQIIFTGEQLNQDDHDLFMLLVYMANHRPFGELVRVPASAILAELGRGRGGNAHERLKRAMHRLVTATINIKINGINFIGHLLDTAFQDENEPKERRYWNYRLNPEVGVLFGYTQFTIIDWEQRKKLKQKELAKWLQGFYATHADPFPLSVSYLWKLCGSKTKELWKFRQNLKIALEDVKQTGAILSWQIDEKDIVYIERLQNVAQIKRTGASPEQPQLAPVVFVNNGNTYLQTTTIEKFRKLYPRLDPYACKSDFDMWLHGKPNPQSYDAAFLGFAAKWAKGKF